MPIVELHGIATKQGDSLSEAVGEDFTEIGDGEIQAWP